jgi:hypothetical protein
MAEHRLTKPNNPSIKEAHNKSRRRALQSTREETPLMLPAESRQVIGFDHAGVGKAYKAREADIGHAMNDAMVADYRDAKADEAEATLPFEVRGHKISKGVALVVMEKPDGSCFVRKVTFNKRGKFKKTTEWTPDISPVEFMRQNGIPTA